MAHELKYFGTPDQTGVSLMVNLYAADGTIAHEGIPCTEIEGAAIYVADMPTAAAGLYGVRFFNDQQVYGQGTLNWDGTNEVTLMGVRDQVAALDQALDQATGAAAGAMKLVQELSSVRLIKEGWTKVSDQMESSKTYKLILGKHESGWAVPAANKPAASQAGEIGLPIGDEGFAWSEETPLVQFNDIPIWVWTAFGKDQDPAEVRVLEVA